MVRRWAALSIGGAHSAGVAGDGECYTWGLNDHGQLGVAAGPPKNVPTKMDILRGWDVRAIACGYALLCTCPRCQLPDLEHVSSGPQQSVPCTDTAPFWTSCKSPSWMLDVQQGQPQTACWKLQLHERRGAAMSCAAPSPGVTAQRCPASIDRQ